MALDAWLPIGQKLPDGARAKLVLEAGLDWQVLETQSGGRAVIARDTLAKRWMDSGLIIRGAIVPMQFGTEAFWCLTSGPGHLLAPVYNCKSPESKSEALAFALALKATRQVDKHSPLQDAIYVEKLSRLLPTFSLTSRAGDDLVLGFWLSGGVQVSVHSFRRLCSLMSWIGANHLKEVVEAAGFKINDAQVGSMTRNLVPGQSDKDRQVLAPERFSLPGRPELEDFFNEHVVDIVQNRERYKAFGIEFPSAIVLHGPPGCGKTYAVERLVEFLGWPSFRIEASSVASPYIHETSRKVAEVFEKAMQNAPSVLIIDEMEAFLADRESGGLGSPHRVEEVAEFLRRIPEAAKNEVLIVAMTNRVEMIDPAILRRGRFDHVVKVDFASEDEIRSLLDTLFSTLPKERDVNAVPLAKKLAGRPLSDVTFVVREGARLSARAGNDKLSQQSLVAALEAAPARDGEGSSRHIGFV